MQNDLSNFKNWKGHFEFKWIVSPALHFSPDRDIRSYMTLLWSYVLFSTMNRFPSSGNLLTSSQQSRLLGKEERTEWGRRDFLEPARVSGPIRTDRNLQFLTACDPSPLRIGMSFGRNWPVCGTEEKKSDDHGLNPTFTLVSLAKHFFKCSHLSEFLSHYCPTLVFYSTLFLITLYCQLFQSLPLILLEHVRIQAQYSIWFCNFLYSIY